MCVLGEESIQGLGVLVWVEGLVFRAWDLGLWVKGLGSVWMGGSRFGGEVCTIICCEYLCKKYYFTFHSFIL